MSGRSKDLRNVGGAPEGAEPVGIPVLPPLAPAQLAALRSDIQHRGVLVPVELDQDGKIIDGHQRRAIAAELGLDVPTVTRTFATDAERAEHVLALNLRRRHLDPATWGALFEQLCAARGVRVGQGVRNATSASMSEVAAELGVSDRTARRRVAASKNGARSPRPPAGRRSAARPSARRARALRVLEDLQVLAKKSDAAAVADELRGRADQIDAAIRFLQDVRAAVVAKKDRKK
jgi:hypothetical protein